MTLNTFETDYYWARQPGFETETGHYIERKEIHPIDEIPLLFYQFTLKNHRDHLIKMVPDGCIDIIFSGKPPRPAAKVFGSILKSQYFLHDFEDTDCFGVRIPPGHIQIIKRPIRDLIDHAFDFEELFEADHHIVEKIANEPHFAEKINLFQQTIGQFIDKTEKTPALINHSLKMIYSSKGNINIHLLATTLGCSTRNLRNKFIEHVGISPKLFSEIVRFQFALKMLRDKRAIDDIIFECGYYDQAHIIKEFRKFGQATPQAGEWAGPEHFTCST